MGNACSNGIGVTKDMVAAIQWYRKAADQGYDRAQYNLGEACMSGTGTPQDPGQAVQWWRRAANQGDAIAQFYLGRACNEGAGLPQDRVEALQWFLLAAAQSNEDAIGWSKILQKKLTPEQIATAQRSVQEFHKRPEK